MLKNYHSEYEDLSPRARVLCGSPERPEWRRRRRPRSQATRRGRDPGDVPGLRLNEWGCREGAFEALAPSVGEAATDVGAVSQEYAFGREVLTPPAPRLPRHVIEDHADGPEFPEVVSASPHPDRELLGVAG